MLSIVISVRRIFISDEIWLVDMIAPQPRPIERMKGFFGKVEELTPDSGIAVTVLGTLSPKGIATDEKNILTKVYYDDEEW